MKNQNLDQVIGFPVRSLGYEAEMTRKSAAMSESTALSLHSLQHKRKRVDFKDWMSKFSKKADSYAKSLSDHVNIGNKVSDVLKTKLALSAKILQAGGVERIFRQKFSSEKGEKLLKAFHCYLYTTAGPISGMLFISTKKIAFHSDRSIKVTLPKGQTARVPYKVVIPVGRVKSASQSENLDKPNQKYIHVVSIDGFEFWFMGFLSYQRSFKYLRMAISEQLQLSLVKNNFQ